MQRCAVRRAGPLLIPALAFLLPLALDPAVARADETLLCNHYIRRVPYTIVRPGHYCLSGDLRTAITGGNAITIAADDVLLDLNGFSLDGTAAGTATAANGIFSYQSARVTVRNGAVRGFFDGIQLGAGGARVAGLTVERVRVDRTAVGIAVRGLGGGHVVRDNVVTNSGGSTVPGETNGVGISILGGADVVGNVVIHTFGDSPVAFDLTGGAMTVLNNRVHDSGNLGFGCDSLQHLRDNLVIDTPNAYLGCNLIGGNYP
jgi:hypothetical protein